MKSCENGNGTDPAKGFHNRLQEYVKALHRLPGKQESVLGSHILKWAEKGRGDPNNLPENWLSQVHTIAPQKPALIAETGYIAEHLKVPEYRIDVAGTPEWQNVYMGTLLEASEALEALFVIWWTIADFDALWNGPLGKSPLGALWRDTGLYNEDLAARPSLATWDAWLELPRRQSGSGQSNDGGGGGGCFLQTLPGVMSQK